MSRSLGSSATGRAQLRKLVVQSLCKQGFLTQAGLIVPPDTRDKNNFGEPAPGIGQAQRSAKSRGA